MADRSKAHRCVALSTTASAAAFGCLVRSRNALFDVGLFRSLRVDVPVISVGNIASGGSGKTPFVRLLVQRLLAIGRRPCVVSRGYGRFAFGGDDLVVVSVGDGPCVDVLIAGDEPHMLAATTRASVVVSRDRHFGAMVAVRELDADTIVLDDGFQHRRLHRDLDVVLVDARRPTGNGRMLPAGPLRESVASLARAGLVVLNHGSTRFATDDAREFVGARPAIDVAVSATSITSSNGSVREPPDVLSGSRVALLTGIANPQRVVETLTALDADVVHWTRCRDHAWFDTRTLDAFAASARRANAERLLTTEKDAVRLSPVARAMFSTIAVEHRVLHGDEVLDAEIDRALRGGSSR